MPSTSAGSWGRIAENAAIRKYGLERITERGPDLKASNGTRYQVKSADTSRSNPRFRFWYNDHRIMSKIRGCYILVLYNSENGSRPIRKIEKVPVKTVGAAANWGPSGHSKGKQAKIPVSKLL